MTKAEISQIVAAQLDLKPADVAKVLDATHDVITEQVKRGEPVYFRGFGTYQTKYRAQKTGRNISQNTTVVVPAHHIPYFKPSKVFTAQVRKNLKAK